jgi:hypothetical protein
MHPAYQRGQAAISHRAPSALPSRRVLRLATAAIIALALFGCGGDDEPPAPRRAAPPAPPDGGVARGHGADTDRVAVPDRDASPPEAAIALAIPGGRTLAEATQPPGDQPGSVELDAPRLRGTATARDQDGGVARVRVSITERITCLAAGGAFERRRTRYFPPPQIERIRVAPGTRLPTARTRSMDLELAGGRCGDADVVAVHGELWGEAINGTGLEAVTPHILFAYRAD